MYAPCKKGETLWNVAANNLKADGKSASNKEIMAEMNRLAKLNGYDSYKDFNHDFFGKGSGKEFLIKDESLSQETKTDNTQKTQDPTASTKEAPKENSPTDSTKLDSQATPKSAFDKFVANNDKKNYILETDDNGNKTVSYKGADGKNHKRIYDNNGTLRYEEQTHSTHRESLPFIGHSTIEEHDTFFTQKTKYDADGNKTSDDLYSTDKEYHGRKMFGKTSRPTEVRHRHTNLMNNK